MCLRFPRHPQWYALPNATLPKSFAGAAAGAMRLLLHIEASDWRTAVFVNRKSAGPVHEGGYSRFSYDVTDLVASGASSADVAVHVFDPSDSGTQPFGKQKVSAIDKPRGDHYTPSSGIWGSVWFEAVSSAAAVTALRVTPTMASFRVEVEAAAAGIRIPDGDAAVIVTVNAPGEGGDVVAQANGLVGVPIDVQIPAPRALWSAESPSLYRISLQLSAPGAAPADPPADTPSTYGGLRTVGMGKDSTNVTRPLLNGAPVFFNGWLDQGWWPDGLYSAPTDAALLSDLQAVKAYGLNMLRKHQKVESQRFYFHASTLGVMLWQDAPQHFFGGADFQQFLDGALQMVRDLYSQPCVVQWVVFNEGDCVKDKGMHPAEAVARVYGADPTRLVDTNSGGPANDLGIGDVNDIHHYSPPAFPSPSDSQYASIGEFGGIGFFLEGHVWEEGHCYGYADVATSGDLVTKIMGYLDQLKTAQATVSAAVYTQTTDVETECDGPLLNYDRTRKLSPEQEQQLAAANRGLITGFADRVKLA